MFNLSTDTNHRNKQLKLRFEYGRLKHEAAQTEKQRKHEAAQAKNQRKHEAAQAKKQRKHEAEQLRFKVVGGLIGLFLILFAILYSTNN